MSKRKEEYDEEEEEDYMSNEFLNQLEDKRPGLVSRSVAKKYETEKRSQQKIKENNLKSLQTSSKSLEKINREEALNKSTLDESNKGFNLMLKMGYKKGEALGSQETKLSASRLIEPIKVELKADRSGLGQIDEKKRKLDQYQKTMQVKQQTNQQIENVYRDTKRHRFLFKKLRSSLFKCQKICYQLDSTLKGLEKPEKAKWFWPNNIIKEIFKNENTEKEAQIEQTVYNEEILIESEENKIEINETISNNSINPEEFYNQRLELFLNNEEYTFKTGQKVNKEEETDEEEDNKFMSTSNAFIEKERENSDIEPNGDEEDEQENEEVIMKRIETICGYLRENYNYCVWCGIKYDSNDDLTNNCPGLTQNDHEDYE